MYSYVWAVEAGRCRFTATEVVWYRMYNFCRKIESEQARDLANLISNLSDNLFAERGSYIAHVPPSYRPSLLTCLSVALSGPIFHKQTRRRINFDLIWPGHRKIRGGNTS